MKKLLLFIAALAALTTAHAQWSGTNPLYTQSKVGIGTTAPSARLDVRSSSGGATGPALSVSMGQGSLVQGGPNYTNAFEVKNVWTGFTNSVTYLDFVVAADGIVNVRNKMRIGANAANGTYSNYALSVDGRIIAKECVIQITDWADYVFAENYALRPLNEVEQFINTNKHLPEIPSEKQVLEEGVGLGEMNKLLLKKVEELTLYIIDQDKRLKELESRTP